MASRGRKLSDVPWRGSAFLERFVGDRLLLENLDIKAGGRIASHCVRGLVSS